MGYFIMLGPHKQKNLVKRKSFKQIGNHFSAKKWTLSLKFIIKILHINN